MVQSFHDGARYTLTQTMRVLIFNVNLIVFTMQRLVTVIAQTEGEKMSLSNNHITSTTKLAFVSLLIWLTNLRSLGKDYYRILAWVDTAGGLELVHVAGAGTSARWAAHDGGRSGGLQTARGKRRAAAVLGAHLRQ